MRLTNDLRKSWLRLVFEERKGVIDEAVGTILKVPLVLYHATYSEEEQQCMNALPDGWLPTAWYSRDPGDMGELEGGVELEQALKAAVWMWDKLDTALFSEARVDFQEYSGNPFIRFHRSNYTPKAYRVWEIHARCGFTPAVRYPDVLRRRRDEIVEAVRALNEFEEAFKKLWQAAKAATSTARLKTMVPELVHLVDELEGAVSGRSKSTAIVRQVPCEAIEALGLECKR